MGAEAADGHGGKKQHMKPKQENRFIYFFFSSVTKAAGVRAPLHQTSYFSKKRRGVRRRNKKKEGARETLQQLTKGAVLAQ